MSRPKPKVYLEHTDPTTYKAIEIISAEEDAFFGVFMKQRDGSYKAVNVRRLHRLLDRPGPKYLRVPL